MPMIGKQSVFRIDCEYAGGAMKWVVYRTLRDFISLHTHYQISNTYNRSKDDLPEFPKTSEFITITKEDNISDSLLKAYLTLNF